MTGLALSIALQFASRVPGTPHSPYLGPPQPGVDIRQEIRELSYAKGESLRVLTRSYEPKTIALTFDDGPHAGKTEKLLKLLKELDLKATFFVVGKMVDKYPGLVREELADGDEVGNHTYDHLNLDNLTTAQVALEYRECSDAIERATGYRPRFCRPPGGRFDTDVVKIASDEGMYTVLWTDDPGDFARPSASVLVERIDSQMHNGGILLLHDGIPQTLDILPEVVRQLRERGYKFVTCSQLLAQRERAIVLAHHVTVGGKSTLASMRRRASR